MGKNLTSNFSEEFARSAPKLEHKKAARVDYLHSLLAPTVTVATLSLTMSPLLLRPLLLFLLHL